MKSYVVAHVSEGYCCIYECVIKQPYINIVDMKHYAQIRQCQLYELDFDWRYCFQKFRLTLEEVIHDYEYYNRNALYVKKIYRFFEKP